MSQPKRVRRLFQESLKNIRIDPSIRHVIVLGLVCLLGAGITDYRSHGNFVRLPQVRDIQWPAPDRLPLLAAAVFFAFLSLLTVAMMAELHFLRNSIDRRTEHIKRGLQAHLFICLLTASFYLCAYYFDRHVLHKMPDEGDHMIMRVVHWAGTTPIQWYIFGCSYVVHQKAMHMIYVLNVTAQMFAFLTLIFQGEMLQWLFGLAAYISFITMFHLVFRTPLLPETAKAAKVIQYVTLIVWLAYPAIYLARNREWISPWLEQIVLYTTLDCVTKGITFGSAIASRFLLILGRIDGTMQLVRARNDFCLVVDSNFKVLDAVWDAPSVSQVFDKNSVAAPSDWSLLQRCLNEEYADSLNTAAQVADSQHSTAPSPSCVAAFQLEADTGYVLTECHVSKCVQGRRVIGGRIISRT